MAEERALTVAQAMGLARKALETVTVRVIGEVSDFSDKPGYKAAYFTVCDESAAMSCMMWRDAYLASGVTLTCGALVEMSGTFSAYVPKGRMQFMVKSLAPAGEGMLRMQVAELARRLEAEGLMRAERKRGLPAYPERIAVVTSPRGKAVHDVIRTLRRRYPIAELLVAGVAVEGVDAPSAIVEGLRRAAEESPDVIVLVRGGGSYEDLMPFNHESVARAVATCPVPVVTGIGHEPDNSIADMVSDLRASTPTAAAEAVAPSLDEVRTRLAGTGRRLARALAHALQSSEHRVRLLAHRPVFCDPTVLVGPAWQRLDGVGDRLARAIPLRMERDAARLDAVRERMLRAGPHLCDRARSSLGHLGDQLQALSPEAVLGRGYAVCFAADGRSVVRSPEQVAAGDPVVVRVQRGRIGCVVETTDMEA